MIDKSTAPGTNAEMRDVGHLVPNERFFVRNHTATPCGSPTCSSGAGLRRRRGIDVMPQGLDARVVADGADQGHVRRPLPVEKALDDALLAFEMNGEELPPDHGFPLRLVVPGWIGIASIKWLGRIEVGDGRLTSPWSTKWYRMTGPAYPDDSPPLTTQPVKSAFELAWDAELPAGRDDGGYQFWAVVRHPVRIV